MFIILGYCVCIEPRRFASNFEKAFAMTCKQERFNPFPQLDTSRGAPLGRHSSIIDLVDIDQLCTSHPQGEYDSGGAYWGYGGKEGPVYAVWVRGKGRNGVAYIRARSASHAKAKVCA